MTKKEAIKIFEEKKVRTVWDDETEEWFFSIVDVVSILTESVDGRKYWNKLKQRLKAEGSEKVSEKDTFFFVMLPVHYPFLFLNHLWSSQLSLFEKPSYRNK